MLRFPIVVFSALGGAAALDKPELPQFPDAYTAVLTLALPYASLTVPLKVAVDTQAGTEKIDFFQVGYVGGCGNLIDESGHPRLGKTGRSSGDEVVAAMADDVLKRRTSSIYLHLFNKLTPTKGN